MLGSEKNRFLKMKDYYKTLGVSKTATQEEIKAAYRELARKEHPDKGGDAERFNSINEAYEILGDSVKRRAHDESQSQKPIENLKEVVREVVDEYFSNLNQ